MQSQKRHIFFILVTALATLLLLAACGPAADADAADAAQAPAQQATAAPEEQESTADGSIGASAPVVAALEGTLETIYEDVNPSVVHIQVTMGGDGETQAQPNAPSVPGLPEFDLPQQMPLRGEGSGFVWDEEGHIVTNNHVVEGASEIRVIFSDGTIVPATIVGSDRDSDLAVIKVDVPAEELQPVQVGDSTAVSVGELVVAIGNPFGQEGTMTVGIVSAIGRLLPVQTGGVMAPHYSIPDIIQTDAAINPGNSGGVLLNDQGEVVGVTTAIISPAQVSAGVGFAIPSATVQNVVPALIENGEFQHSYLGISGVSLTPELAEAADLPASQRGALVMEVTPEGPAAEAGVQGGDEEVEIDGTPVQIGGDVITAIDEQPVQGMDDIITYLARSTQVGDTVTLTVLRDGEEQQIEITLGARPEQTTPEQIVATDAAWLGILGATVTPEIAEAMGLPADSSGVLVAEVVDSGPAAEAGLLGSTTTAEINGQQMPVGGDVIVAVDGESVSGMQELQATLAEYSPGDEVTLTALRDGEEVEVDVTLGQRPN